MRINTPTIQSTALWLGDLHLDRTCERQRRTLFSRISSTESSCVIVSGDISSSQHLREHLLQLASACAPRPLYFVLGNHDYYGSSINEVKADMTELIGSGENLHHLDGKRIIPLGGDVCLIGHDGWADARAGYGHGTVIDSPDRNAISDFRGLSHKQTMQRMTALGKESAVVIRKILPLALSLHRHVVIVTHAPPFPSAVMYGGKPCGPTHLPHFANLSVGMAILGITRAFPKRRITVLSGHTHSGCVKQIQPNLSMRVGHARTGMPDVFDVIRF